jgi:hypothetical protein
MGPADASAAEEKPVGNYQIAKPPTGGSQLLDLDLMIESEGVERFGLVECVRPFDVRAAEVDFQAANDRSPLPVVAELEAENSTAPALEAGTRCLSGWLSV